MTLKVCHSVMLTTEKQRGQEVGLLVTVGIQLLDERQPHSFRWLGRTRDWIEDCVRWTRDWIDGWL